MVSTSSIKAKVIAYCRDWLVGQLPQHNLDPALMNSDSAVRRAGYVLAFVLVFGFGTWAGCAPLESAAYANGKVEVEGSSKIIQHFEGGIVSEILVANGDYVTPQQPLIQLDVTRFKAELDIIRGQVWAHLAHVDRLKSERDGLASVEFSGDLMLIQDERAQSARENEVALFDVRRADRYGEVSMLRQRILQLSTQSEGIREVLEAKTKVRKSIEEEIAELSKLLADGYVDKQRIRMLDRSLAEVYGEISDLEAQTLSVSSSIDEANLKILQLEKRFMSSVVNELAQTHAALFDLRQRELAANDRVQRASIKAPLAGIVVGMKPNIVGAAIAPREALLSIVPDVDKLVVSARLSPMDVDRIYVGQDAEVRFSVFKDAYTISGTLVSISADSLEDSKSGVSYFEAKIELKREDLQLLGQYQLMPGMPAEVLVKTGTRTMLSYMLSPLVRAFSTALIEE